MEEKQAILESSNRKETIVADKSLDIDSDGIVYKNEKKPVIKKPKNSRIYFGYIGKVIWFIILLVSLIGTSVILILKSINVTAGKKLLYEENGNIDYKVYLKPNQFYEEPYLANGLTYLAVLINNIDTNFSYTFSIEEAMDLEIIYDVIAKLKICNSDGQQLFEKEYTLISKQKEMVKNSKTITINNHIDLNYDEYNNLANEFKTTFGVETTSDLDVIIKINKVINNASGVLDINSENKMTMSVPLTRKTLNIAINSTDINTKNSIVEEDITTSNIKLLIASGILLTGSVICLLKLLELLFLISPKKSKYDKIVQKILNNYDRLIVETESQPNFAGTNIIKIVKFQELLDVRDNLKMPIMYYIVTPHIKCYFYILLDNNCYLMTVKANDVEKNEAKKR